MGGFNFPETGRCSLKLHVISKQHRLSVNPQGRTHSLCPWQGLSGLFNVKHKPVQIDLLQTEFIKAEWRQDYGSPEKFKARLTWARRVVASDRIKEGGQFTTVLLQPAPVV